MNFVLIDGSYYVFYRYYALRVWWNNVKTDADSNVPCENEKFMEKYYKTFSSKIEEIDKKLGLKKSIKLVGKDCPHKDIWRTKLYPNYKGNRHGIHSPQKDATDIKKVFSCTYNAPDNAQDNAPDNLFARAGINVLLSHPNLEGDDCIAITTKYILDAYTDAHVWIITSDMDYLQLASDRVHLFDLKFNDLTKSKKTYGDPKKDLFCKIVSGDKSDNILPIFPKCGIKTAEKLYENQEIFKNKLQDPLILQQYNLNSLLVDFNNIPEDLVREFKENSLKLSINN